MNLDRITKEKEFHDAWAFSENVANINVLASNEACTAPEMRYISKRLGNLKGKTLLDVGCGLGEASVYFALRGADVTSCDLSEGMLTVTSKLAEANSVKLRTHLASAEDMMLPEEARFDIIYAGNLLHHVDIDTTLKKIKLHLAPGGMLVTWDPLAYNPVINVYRRLASSVRTPDEHPLKLKDLQLFRNHFKRVETNFFWFFTLIIFVIMALVQRRNPNKERYWKSVVDEGHKWEWIYKPLEILDKLTLFLLPPLRLLCWNVVVIAQNEK
jgi:SAM-dependent methyltransferase